MANTNKPFAMFFNANPRKGWNTAKMLEAAKVLPPKAFGGSSIKSNVAALEAFVDERIASK